MVTRFRERIAGIKDFGALRQFQLEVVNAGGMEPGLPSEIRDRYIELGREYLTHQLGVDPSVISPAEREVIKAVGTVTGLMKIDGKVPNRTIAQLKRIPILEAVERTLRKSGRSQGFETLADAGLDELSYERIVLQYPSEFSPEATWHARRNLGLVNKLPIAPVGVGTATEVNTNTILAWFEDSAGENGGRLPAFSNSDIASLLDMHPHSSYGRVLGSLQSRIDFACYRANLPPLGCAAESPYSKAWDSKARSWRFDVPAMQYAAKTREWSGDDFTNIREIALELPGQGATCWKQEIEIRENSVRTWAVSFPLPEGSLEAVSSLKRNPAWQREELLLALELYLRRRESPPGPSDSAVILLSELLSRMRGHWDQALEGTYRNPNGVSMKLMNFRRFDPQFTRDGKTGLTRGNRLEEEVWNRFSDDLSGLGEVCDSIRKVYADPSLLQHLNLDEPDIDGAEEGAILARYHRYRERDPRLVSLAKKRALKLYGNLRCEVCAFDFSTAYGAAGEGYIEVHHTKPLHALIGESVTKLDDLALLCANCHRVVHRKRSWLSVDDVKQAFFSQSQEVKRDR